MKMIKRDKIVELLREACERSGSQKKFADANGVTQAYVCDVLNGKREPGKSILKALSYQSVKMYHKELREMDSE